MEKELRENWSNKFFEGAVFFICFILFSCDMILGNKGTYGFADEPLVYLYNIKESTLPYIYLKDSQKIRIENCVNAGDIAVLKFELNKIRIELNEDYPLGREGENGVLALKIDNSISMLNDLLAISDITLIRTNYFSKYRYKISAIFEYNARICWKEISGSKNILENRVTEGNLSNFKTFVKQIINELEKLKEEYAQDRWDVYNSSAGRMYDRILAEIIEFNKLLSYNNMDDIRKTNYFVKAVE
jgi:uncharacterized protein (UPF0335 family)